MKVHTLILLLALTIGGAACAGSAVVEVSDEAAAAAGSPAQAEAADAPVEAPAPDVVADAQASVADVADSLEDAQAAAGGGSATLAVGDQSWTFGSLLCAFGEGETGQADAEFVVSSIQDGTQFYLSIDQFGHSASLSDIADFANPSVSLDSTGPYTDIVLDGNSFSGTGEFLDGTSDSFDRLQGTFSGTCP